MLLLRCRQSQHLLRQQHRLTRPVLLPLPRRHLHPSPPTEATAQIPIRYSDGRRRYWTRIMLDGHATPLRRNAGIMALRLQQARRRVCVVGLIRCTPFSYVPAISHRFILCGFISWRERSGRVLTRHLQHRDAGKDICGFEQGFMQNYASSTTDSGYGAQVNSWYDGEEAHYAQDGDYELDNPRPAPLGPDGKPEYETGHFSAMGKSLLLTITSHDEDTRNSAHTWMITTVWKDSVYVGCAKQHCPGGLSNMNPPGPETYFLVCDYALPGNMGGHYRSQVLRPTAH